MDRAELNKRLDYLKMAHPESAESIQQAQNFIEAMVEIQTSAGSTSGELEAVKEGIKAMAHRPHSKEPFVLNEAELHVLHDMLHERLKHAEKELPSGHGSLEFDEGLLYKLIDAMAWARHGDTVKVSREAKEQKA